MSNGDSDHNATNDERPRSRPTEPRARGESPPPFRTHTHVIIEAGRPYEEEEHVPLPPGSTRGEVRPGGSPRESAQAGE
jgi:hypothetical protein